MPRMAAKKSRDWVKYSFPETRAALQEMFRVRQDPEALTEKDSTRFRKKLASYTLSYHRATPNYPKLSLYPLVYHPYKATPKGSICLFGIPEAVQLNPAWGSSC